MIFRLKGKLVGWITSIASVFALFFFLTLIPNVKARFVEILIDEYKQENPLLLNDYQGYHFTGGNIRLAIWKICIEAVNAEKAWVIGVGPGDTQTILTQSYIEKHIYSGNEIHEGFLHYNAHNQFFQYYVSLGIIGLGFFIVILGVVIVTIFTKANMMAGCISIIFLSFCFTESVMERQKGIVFFTFFSCLLVAKIPSKVANIRTLG
jgi:O-antigen ligase